MMQECTEDPISSNARKRVLRSPRLSQPQIPLSYTRDPSFGPQVSVDFATTKLTDNCLSDSTHTDEAFSSTLKKRELTDVEKDTRDISIDALGELTYIQQLQQWAQRLQRTFGTSFVMLVATVYCAQGFMSFSKLALNYFFKDNLALEPAESQALLTIVLFPWGIKPLYGIMSDSLPLFQYHRKSYIIICSFVGLLSFLILSIPNGIQTPFGSVMVLTIQSFAVAFIDVVIDARVVEVSRLDPVNGANDLQSVSWGAMAIGGVIGSTLSGPATETLGVRASFFFAAIGPLLVFIMALRMTEKKVSIASSMCLHSASRQLRHLKEAIGTPVIWKCALWIFLSHAVVPSYSQITFYYATEFLHFSPEFIGSLSALGFVFLLLGTLLYNAFFKEISFRRIFFISQLSLAVISFLDILLVTRVNLELGIPDQIFVLGDTVIVDVIGRLKAMPVLVLSSKLCPKGVEGTMFALLMSISNFSFSVSEFVGAIIASFLGISRTSYQYLWCAVLIRSTMKIVPLFFLFLIPSADPQIIVDDLEFSVEESSRSESPPSGTIRHDHVAKSSPDVEAEEVGMKTRPLSVQ
uniref:FolateBiopterin Transporter (FBT) family putative n=1 Tax=Albugo laibachii Nc14 TaxID=890382 RepID=F0WMV7_9STRA|nr:folateBiopterin Transporter (FBT) family putative [Albugo laibachii Nc14]|eukprot:CCA22642.1 folateBiopterin Transporter (FBT) family putative [Albugo laibachii Nc14]